MSDTFIVPAGVCRCRADKALAGAFPQHSRSAWQRALDRGQVKRADQVLRRRDEVSAGDELTYQEPAMVKTDLTPANIPLSILWEDEHLMVIDKPAGMVVHPGSGTDGTTLVHALLHHCAGSLSGIGGVERPGIVHRLDRHTTGALVVAKSDAAHRGLAEQFAERRLLKEYFALGEGIPRLLSGTIDRGIFRHPTCRDRMTTGATGRSARTDWMVVEKFPTASATLFRCQIHTGRTHQIRVHMQFIGHPLLGDRTYGWRPDPRQQPPPARVMLHAVHLQFTHPLAGQTIDIEAPLPADFAGLMNELREQGVR